MTEDSNTQVSKAHDMKKMRTGQKGGKCAQSGTGEICRKSRQSKTFSRARERTSIGKGCLQGMALEEISERQC